MKRAHLTAEDVSAALLRAGIDVTAETCLATKFWQVANELSANMRGQFCGELRDFAAVVLYEHGKEL